MAKTDAVTASAGLPRGIWVLGFVSMFMDISSEMVHSLLPVFLVTTLGASAFTVGLIEGAAESVALMVKVFSGALSDYLGRRKALAVVGYSLGALSKPLFAVATSAGMVFGARFVDRIGKGVRGAPRDALVADLVAPEVRGSAYGLRQSLDTVGAFTGPLLAVALMLLWANDFRAVFAVAIVPGVIAVVLLVFGVREPAPSAAPGGPAGAGAPRPRSPVHWRELQRLGSAYWWVVVIGAIVTLARFSEAFLVLRAQDGGLSLAWIPLVLVAMNLVYAAAAWPFGWLSDRTDHARLLMLGLVILLGADLVLALAPSWPLMLVGVGLWGLHLGITQGLLATMVAAVAPAHLRGTAFGFFNLLSGATMLVASGTAGLVWDLWSPAATFHVGAGFCVLAMVAIGAYGQLASALATDDQDEGGARASIRSRE